MPPPVGTDTDPGAVTTQISGIPSDSIFPAGTTTNTFEVEDIDGNTAQCSFTVTVEDDADLVIISDGGAGPGMDFVTDLAHIIVTGTASNCTANIVVSGPPATVDFNAALGTFSATLTLIDGINAAVFNAVNGDGKTIASTTLIIVRDSTLSAQIIEIVPGFNMIGIALDPANSMSASGLLGLFGTDVDEIQRLDSVTGLYEILARDGENFQGVDFAVRFLDALNIIASAPASTRIVGTTVSSPTINLQSGANGLRCRIHLQTLRSLILCS